MLLPLSRLYIKQKPKGVVSQQRPLGRAVHLRQAGFHKPGDKQDTGMPKSTAGTQFDLSPPAQQLLDQEGQELTELRMKVNVKIFSSVYFLIYLLRNKCYSNSDIFDLSFTAQLNY